MPSRRLIVVATLLVVGVVVVGVLGRAAAKWADDFDQAQQGRKTALQQVQEQLRR